MTSEAGSEVHGRGAFVSQESLPHLVDLKKPRPYPCTWHNEIKGLAGMAGWTPRGIEDQWLLTRLHRAMHFLDGFGVSG